MLWLQKIFCHGILQSCYLRNEFNLWNVHGILNTSGLLQETRSIQDSINIPKIKFIAHTCVFTFYAKYLKYKKYL